MPPRWLTFSSSAVLIFLDGSSSWIGRLWQRSAKRAEPAEEAPTGRSRHCCPRGKRCVVIHAQDPWQQSFREFKATLGNSSWFSNCLWSLILQKTTTSILIFKFHFSSKSISSVTLMALDLLKRLSIPKLRFHPFLSLPFPVDLIVFLQSFFSPCRFRPALPSSMHRRRSSWTKAILMRPASRRSRRPSTIAMHSMYCQHNQMLFLTFWNAKCQKKPCIWTLEARVIKLKYQTIRQRREIGIVERRFALSGASSIADWRSPWEGETSLNNPNFPSLSDCLKQVFSSTEPTSWSM